jgi:hypothetical protein
MAFEHVEILLQLLRMSRILNKGKNVYIAAIQAKHVTD